MLKYLNLALLIAFPIAWFAPLMRAGFVLPIFGLSEVSVFSGILSLFDNNAFLAMVVFLFAIVAPITKTVGMALLQFGYISPQYKEILFQLSRLAMADIFLIALYIVILKGVTFTRVETGWGLYLFTACVLTSIAISFAAAKRQRA